VCRQQLLGTVFLIVYLIVSSKQFKFMSYLLEKKSYSLFYLGSVRKKWRLALFIDNRPKGCFVYGCFVSTDVLSRRKFCLYGRFVPTDVLSLRTFCPYGRFVPRTLCLRLFCLRTFSPYGRFVSGRFVRAPSKADISKPFHSQSNVKVK
jgi:hypothetical protein